jgi:predicted nuclease of predicted toxin-antitoxin system
MRLLVDANLSPRLATDLRRRGHDAEHVDQIGLYGADDTTILTWARDHDRIVVTSDLDFADLAAAGVGAPAKVLLLRLRSSRVEAVLPRVLVALASTGDALARGAVVVVEESRLRLRQGRP